MCCSINMSLCRVCCSINMSLCRVCCSINMSLCRVCCSINMSLCRVCCSINMSLCRVCCSINMCLCRVCCSIIMCLCRVCCSINMSLCRVCCSINMSLCRVCCSINMSLCRVCCSINNARAKYRRLALASPDLIRGLYLLRSLLTCRTPVTMVNLGRLIAVVTYVILSVHNTAAASDVVNGLTFHKELEKLENEVLGVKKMQVGVVPSCSLDGTPVSSQLSFTSVGNSGSMF